MLSPCTEVNIKHGPLHKNLTLAGPVAVLYSYREARINKVLLNHAESHWAECVSIVPCGTRREGGRGRWPSDLLIGHSTLRLARVCFACVTSAPAPRRFEQSPSHAQEGSQMQKAHLQETRKVALDKAMRNVSSCLLRCQRGDSVALNPFCDLTQTLDTKTGTAL